MRILAVLLLLPSLSLSGDASDDALRWLVGCWTTPDGSSQEVWIAESNGTLSGFSVSIADNRVSSYELLSIRPGEGGALVYTAHPVGQASTSFTAAAIMENSAVFVNAEHDYPQRIKYTRAASQLTATISRLNGTKPVSFDKIACD